MYAFAIAHVSLSLCNEVGGHLVRGQEVDIFHVDIQDFVLFLVVIIGMFPNNVL